jgi:hypothetical protein
MGSVSRRAFIASGGAGAIGIAGVAAGGLNAIGLTGGQSGRATETELTPEEIQLASKPMMLHVRDVSTGEIELLVDEKSVVFTDKSLVARVLRTNF